jgi:hypothetical protein
VTFSDVRARLKAAAWARPGGAHGLGQGQAEPKLSRGAGPRLGLGLGRGFLEGTYGIQGLSHVNMYEWFKYLNTH